jgi:hypothetical protein
MSRSCPVRPATGQPAVSFDFVQPLTPRRSTKAFAQRADEEFSKQALEVKLTDVDVITI